MRQDLQLEALKKEIDFRNKHEKGKEVVFPLPKEEAYTGRMQRENMFGDKHMYSPERPSKRDEEQKIWFKEQHENYEAEQK